MTTLGDVIEDVQSYLYSYDSYREKVTSLAAGIPDAASLTFQVADGSQVDRGLVEIGDELVTVLSADRMSGLVTVQPFGRGSRGSAAVPHAAGTRVTSNPRWPRSRIVREINQTIANIYPDLFRVQGDVSLTTSPVTVTYPLPANVETVLNVSYQSIGPSQRWVPVTRFRLDHDADPDTFPTGRSLDIFQPMQPGRRLKVIYATSFGQLALSTDTFDDVGLDDGWADIIRLGACYRMLGAFEPARLQVDSIEAAERGALTQPLAATQIAAALRKEYVARVAEERGRLLRTHPTPIVRHS